MSIFQHLVERRRAHGSDGFRSEQGVGGRRRTVSAAPSSTWPHRWSTDAAADWWSLGF